MTLKGNYMSECVIHVTLDYLVGMHQIQNFLIRPDLDQDQILTCWKWSGPWDFGSGRMWILSDWIYKALYYLIIIIIIIIIDNIFVEKW